MYQRPSRSRGSLSSKALLMFAFGAVWMLILGRRALNPPPSMRQPADEPEHVARRLGKPEDTSEDFLAQPHPRGKVKFWHGQTYEENGEWDFFGLKVPNSPAITRVREGQIRADYDLAKVNASETPRGYGPPATGEPAFKYPDRNDRLFVTASTVPRALFFPDLVTDEEVEEIISQASPKISRSLVATTLDGKRRGESVVQDVRTSKSTWINLTGKLENLNKRLTAIMGTTWHEPMNVLRYGPKQHYDAHQDYFDPARYGPQTNHRMATFYLYLSDTEEGGATTIPRANAGRFPPNYQAGSCNQGLQVYPRKGSAVLFYDMRPDFSLDPMALHGACDVIKGVKWGGPVWFHAPVSHGQGFPRDDY